MLPCRLFIDPPAEGAWNMAVDEALLEQADDEGQASLRFYQWSEPTLSLGYFQRYSEREQHAASRGAAVVRRLSGGGALIHDRELTYSLCLPVGHPQSRQTEDLYDLVHSALIKVLAVHGVAAHLHEETCAPSSRSRPSAPADELFLCFARRTAADVVLAAPLSPAPEFSMPPKIVGSAQRRRRGAVLQHGAVLLAASPRAPELPGLERPGIAPLSADELIEPWSALIAQRLNVQLSRANLSSRESLQLRKDLLVKHVSESWLRRR